MSKLIEFFNGKKTYICSGIAAIIAVLQVFGVVGVIPEYIWAIVGAAGLASVRDALGKVQK